MSTLTRILAHFQESARLQDACGDLLSPAIVHAAECIVAALLQEKKILACGNGGSAALAQHFAACMLNRFELERPGLAAIPLAADNATLTAIANDSQYAQIFSKQILALGQEHDILLTMSVSGQSANVLQAVRAGHERGMRVIALTGGDGGELLELLQERDIHIGVPHEQAARVQEVFMLCIHGLCDAIDHLLLGVE